jgi:hypothetical protein
MPVLLHRATSRAIVAAGVLMLATHTPVEPTAGHLHAQAPAATTAQDAQQAINAGKEAAERRRKFEEEKRRLEGGEQANPPETPSDRDQTFFVSPARATMLVGEAWLFSSFDIRGKTLTDESEWTVSSSSVVDVSTVRTGLITAKAPGTVTVRAQNAGRSAEATVTVLSGTKLPPLTIRWLAPQIPGFTIKKLFPSGPGATKVAVTFFEQNAQGEALLRAFTSNGQQLWMKRGADLFQRDGAH